ncbi:hypothetical protein E2C01_001020 [Portunus trituberculatus]|uniref:Uncharacterized protein n=1 Tax=Portunus trituberculatus TaxID=210409 RepID=A0A5B7CLG0_PORTR|nr:hypothetical protein [Portunus trituberculatus]
MAEGNTRKIKSDNIQTLEKEKAEETEYDSRPAFVLSFKARSYNLKLGTRQQATLQGGGTGHLPRR